MKINRDIIAELNADILSTIRINVPLKKAGTSWLGLCPFHGEKTPSFRVHEGRNKYKCFGCGASGDAINFVREINGFKTQHDGFQKACVEIGKLKGIEIQERSLFEINHDEENIYILLNNFKEHTLKRDVSDYLRNRGLSDQTIKFFDLGYYGNDFRVDKDIAIQSGLMSSDYNLMSNRLTIPIKNKWGKVIAFGGRTLDGNFKEKKIAKYLNTSNSIVYDKSATLYNYWNAIEFATSEKNMIVVEGYADVWGLWDKGIYNVVAACGTSFTEQHALLILKAVGSSGTVTFAYDNDSAGLKALIKSMHICLKAGLTARFVRLDKDPDEKVQEVGKGGFKELIDNATYFIDILCIRYENNESERITIIEKLKNTLKDCKDVAFKISFIRNLCERLFLTPSVFDNSLSNFSFNSKISFVSLSEEDKLLRQFYAVQHLKVENISVVTHLINNMNNMDCFSAKFNEIIAAIKQDDFSVLSVYNVDVSELDPITAYEHILGLYEKQVLLCSYAQLTEKINNCTDADELKLLLSANKKIKSCLTILQ